MYKEVILQAFHNFESTLQLLVSKIAPIRRKRSSTKKRKSKKAAANIDELHEVHGSPGDCDVDFTDLRWAATKYTLYHHLPTAYTSLISYILRHKTFPTL
jgi:hypothetical protein